jgi:hypothetical protein
VAPTFALLVVQVAQAVSGVTVSQASTPTFQQTFRATVAATLHVSNTSVVIASVTASARREQRRALQSSGGVNIVYTVTATAATNVSSVSAAISTATTKGTFTASLVSAGYTSAAVTGQVVVFDATPTRSPTVAPTSATPTTSPSFPPTTWSSPSSAPTFVPFAYPYNLQPGGVISTYVGSLAGGNSGGPATSAGFHKISGVSLDSSGTLYIVDSLNNCVRKVDPKTTITSTAIGVCGSPSGYSGDGGPATAALLNVTGAYLSVAADYTGNLYVPDR